MSIPASWAKKLPKGTPVRGEALGADVPESEFQKAVIATAEAAGWKVFSIPDSRRATAKGFQDCTFRHDTGPQPVIVAELKKVGERPTKDQLLWHAAWRAMGVPVYVWCPTDWAEIRRVLG